MNLTDVPAGADKLDPLQRAEFDAKPIQTWRVTWPDGTTDTIKCHLVQREGDGVWGFYYLFLGPHRFININHARDIVEESTS
jgi:hypothetical protein